MRELVDVHYPQAASTQSQNTSISISTMTPAGAAGGVTVAI
jgi:hypothetical protein